MDLDELLTVKGETPEEVERISAGILALATDIKQKHYTPQERIESLIRLAQAVERNYESTASDDWQEGKASSKGMFDAYLEFLEWGRGKSSEEVRALTAMPETELTQKIIQIRDTAYETVNKSTESDWTGILSDALDDIAMLCKEQLKS